MPMRRPCDVGAAGGLDDRRHRGVDRRGVHRVVAGDDLVEQGGVEHRAGARAGLVERGRQRDEAVARDAAVGRLGADRAGDGRGLADRATGVGADRQRGLERRDDRRRAAAGPAGDPVEVPRVAARAVGAVLGGGAHRELVHVGLAEDRHPGLAQPGHQGRVVRRHPALQDLRAAGRRQALRRHDVLDGDRHAGEPVRATPPRLGAGRRCRPARARPRRRRGGRSARRRRRRRCGRGGPGPPRAPTRSPGRGGRRARRRWTG